MSNAYYMAFETAESYDRMIVEVEREAAARALEEAASSPIPREALTSGTRTWLRARAAEIRKG